MMLLLDRVIYFKLIHQVSFIEIGGSSETRTPDQRIKSAFAIVPLEHTGSTLLHDKFYQHFLRALCYILRAL